MALDIGGIFNSLGGEHGLIASLCVIILALITNRQKTSEIKLSTEQQNFKLTLDEAATIRKELRENQTKLQQDLVSWQERYYKDMAAKEDRYNKDMAAMQAQVFSLKADVTALQIQIADKNIRNAAAHAGPDKDDDDDDDHKDITLPIHKEVP